MPQSTEPLRVIVWAAVSTNEQADDDKFSLDAQIADALAVADKNEWTVTDTIRIEGHSRNYRTLDKLAAAARSHNEPGFDRLIAHLEACDFDILLCRDANRFARKASLLYEIVDTILEDCNARIYSLSDGFIDANNADMWLMVKGYEIGKQMKWIKKEMARGRHKLVDDKGFPPTGNFVWSHKKVRDEKFKVIGFVPDPAKTLIIEDAARLVVERIGWHELEVALFEQYGHGQNGAPFKPFFFYHLFYNPWFWGDAARNYNNDLEGRRMARWTIDASAPAPDGVVIKRGVNAPAITGEPALQLKAELMRRLNFRPRKHKTVHKFSGLLVCGRCGHTMVFTSAKHNRGYCCQSKYVPRAGSRCERYWYIGEHKIQAWLGTALGLMLENENPFYFVEEAKPAPDRRIEQLEAQIADVDKKARRLISKQAAAPDALSSIYDDQIEVLGKQLETLRQHLTDETLKATKYNVDDIQSAYHNLSTLETINTLWESEEGVINQLIHRLMGNRRLVILDGQIVGTGDI